MRNLIRVAACIVVAGCGASTKSANTSARTDPTPASTMQDDTVGINLVPVGFGTLRQDDIAIKMQFEGIQVKLLPLDESVLRVLSPDSYRALRDLLESRQSQITTLTTRRGIRRQSVWYVSFFGLQPDARFSPMEITITSSARDFRPIELIPLSAGFGSQRLKQRETQSALYLFEDGINVEQPITVSMGGQQNSSWDQTIRQIQRERALIRSRSSRSPTTPAP
jgi:hypothetical protein